MVRNPVLAVTVVTFLVLAPLILLGVWLGYYVGGATGYSKTVLAVLFSTAGFLAAMVIVVQVIRSVVARSPKPRG